MAFIDMKRKEIQSKLVYYGPGRGGKTTNVLHLFRTMSKQVCGKMVTIDTRGDRTLFFDFLPLSVGKIMDLTIRIQVYTVPGQIVYSDTRKLVLRGVDGVVFVADALKIQQQQNIESIRDLAENLKGEKLDIHSLPLVLQYNKFDLAGTSIPTLSVEELEYDLNRDLGVPYFKASAIKGVGVYETLREVSKRMIRNITQKLREGQY
ncbi:GTP-binding protein [Syntrophobacter fumaroxidans]|uniref:Gliding motility protein (MglA) n=1 Tax=Syntrophobacter fumaroxidans (strain DSM 10017 / MPOB) TaxID=335543 RepID=A0LIT9_SYNFM|nr:GTPase domain-containing protein [Syntrophobacter fumaroxidans]ABK17341.1 gliding motility protein (MglA) [Syntrophobacter fumaroxidans MPOB]HOI93691.1 GTPase domain-containing protein [Syntrophobacter fumaroxidans]